MLEAVICPNVTLFAEENATPPPLLSWNELVTMFAGVNPDVPLLPLNPDVPLIPLDPAVPFTPFIPLVPLVPFNPGAPFAPLVPLVPLIPEVPLVPLPPPPPPDTYGKLFQEVTPSPIFNLAVSSSKPASPENNTGFTAVQFAAVSRLS
jgi:hypothetical protein